ncbi:MAG: DUF4199 domain-containing protein [Prevotellaceae bacterium]|jgi:hypothetical protein|nr:DUF4199 domain-containing protein [Prevotellaceae bacterium]
MMENSHKIMKVAAGYGLILGFIMIASQLISFLVPLLSPGIYIAGIIYTTIHYREKYSGGTITYGRSLLFGILVSGFAFIILGMFFYIMFSLYPEYRELLNAVMEKMKTKGLATSETSMDSLRNPVIWVVTYLFLGLFAGLAVSAIVSIFTKKN